MLRKCGRRAPACRCCSTCTARAGPPWEWTWWPRAAASRVAAVLAELCASGKRCVGAAGAGADAGAGGASGACPGLYVASGSGDEFAGSFPDCTPKVVRVPARTVAAGRAVVWRRVTAGWRALVKEEGRRGAGRSWTGLRRCWQSCVLVVRVVWVQRVWMGAGACGVSRASAGLGEASRSRDEFTEHCTPKVVRVPARTAAGRAEVATARHGWLAGRVAPSHLCWLQVRRLAAAAAVQAAERERMMQVWVV